MTARTTAHLATAIDDFYSELIQVAGEDQARLYHESQVAAINRIEAICRDEGDRRRFQAAATAIWLRPRRSTEADLQARNIAACRKHRGEGRVERQRADPRSRWTPGGASLCGPGAVSSDSNISPGWRGRSSARRPAVRPTRAYVSHDEEQGRRRQDQDGSRTGRSARRRCCSRPTRRSMTWSRCIPSRCRCAPMPLPGGCRKGSASKMRSYGTRSSPITMSGIQPAERERGLADRRR